MGTSDALRLGLAPALAFLLGVPFLGTAAQETELRAQAAIASRRGLAFLERQ